MDNPRLTPSRSFGAWRAELAAADTDEETQAMILTIVSSLKLRRRGRNATRAVATTRWPAGSKLLVPTAFPYA
jgi:hypothetical protein